VVPRRRRWPSVVVDVARGRSAVRHHSEGRRRRRHNHLADESASRPDPVRHSAHPNGISIGSADFAGLTVAVQTQYGRLRGVLVSIADPTSSGQPRRSTGPDLSPSPSLGRSQDPRTRRRAGSRPAASKSTWGSSTRPSSAADCASCRPRGRWRSGTADLNVVS